MSEPVRNSTAKVVSPDPSDVKKYPKCKKGEILDVKVEESGDWKLICVPNPGPLGGLEGHGWTCGEDTMPLCPKPGEGLISVEEFLKRLREERVSPPPPSEPQDQFKPAPPESLEKMIKGTAEYSCKTRTSYTEDWIVTRDVSIPKIPNESENVTRNRLEQAARDLAKTISGCHDVKFERLQPIVNGHTKAVAPHSKPPTVVANKCDGEWATRSVCRK